MVTKKKFTLFAMQAFTFVSVLSCTNEQSVDLIVDIPEMVRKDRIASFYGTDAKKLCENYRKVYAGFCDAISQSYVKCYGLNENKYTLTSCE
jgi:hypothetical protein